MQEKITPVANRKIQIQTLFSFENCSQTPVTNRRQTPTSVDENPQPFERIELIEPFEPHKPHKLHKPHKPLKPPS
jgi:hypothetical protein